MNRGHVYQPGEDPLAPHPMTPAQVADLVERVRQREIAVRRVAAAQLNLRIRHLTADQVVEMRERRAAGEKLVALAARYGVSGATVLRIVRGEHYRDVGGPRQPFRALPPVSTGKLAGELKESARRLPIPVKHKASEIPQ